MSADAARATSKDFASDQDVRWCPGCGDYSILANVQRVMPELGIPRENFVFVSGIGCSSRFPYYMDTFGFHSIHGRAPAVATGLKVARPELDVWVITGDGDGLSIGGNHMIHALRRNMDLKIILFNNQIYGLTKGQLSPTSPFGLKTSSSAWGSLEHPVNPLLYVLGYGASFVAQGTPADMQGLAAAIEEGIRFPGFAFVNVQSPCVTYGQEEQQLKAHKAVMQPLASLGHDPADRLKAMALASEYGQKLYTGVFYRNPEPPLTFEAQARKRQEETRSQARPRERILEMFRAR